MANVAARVGRNRCEYQSSIGRAAARAEQGRARRRRGRSGRRRRRTPAASSRTGGAERSDHAASAADWRDYAASVARICCGNTRQSVFVPVPFAARESFLPWADGRFWLATDRLYRRLGCRTPKRLAKCMARVEGAATAAAADWRETVADVWACLQACVRENGEA